MKITVKPIEVDAFGTTLKRSRKVTGEIGDQRKKQNHPDQRTVKIS